MDINVGADLRGVRIHGSVGQRCRAIKEESPALPVARARSVSIGALNFRPSVSIGATGMLTYAMCVVAGGELSRESNPCVTFHRGDGWKFKDT